MTKIRPKILLALATLQAFASSCSTMGWVHGTHWSPPDNSSDVASACTIDGSGEAETISYESSKLTINGGYITTFPLLGPPLLPVIPLPWDAAACRFQFDVDVQTSRPVTIDFTKWRLQDTRGFRKPCHVYTQDNKELKKGPIQISARSRSHFDVLYPVFMDDIDTLKHDKQLSLIVSGVQVNGKSFLDKKLPMSPLDTQFRYCGLAFPGNVCKPINRSLDCEKH